jgi:hypothetical protein
MRVLATWIMAIGLVALPATAATRGAGDDTSPAPKPADAAAAKNKAADKSAAPAKSDTTAKTDSKTDSTNLENELQQLRDLLLAQSKQLQEQSDQLKAQQQKMDSLENQLNSSSAARTISTPSGTPGTSTGESVSIPAAGPMATATVSSGSPAPTSGEASPAQGMDADGPNSIHFKGVTLTPGGFFAAETAWRGKALGADVNTPFNSVPVPGSSQSDLHEFFASGRQSRISMLVEGKLSAVKIGGYYETDFLSAGVTSNNNQSNSYTMRQRQFWAQAAFDNGFKFTGGQMWSLVTETKNGLDNRTEAPPMTIDAAYNVGFSWARQYGFRATKSFDDNKFFLGFSVENPQATVTVHGNLANSLVGTAGVTGGLYDNQANYSFNPSPDFIFKAAAQPSWGHFEIFGVVSHFRDRTFPCVGVPTGDTCPATGTVGASGLGASNDSRTGGGIGVNARVSILQKHLDLGFHAMGGDGTGRYGAAGLPDVTLRPDGTLALIKAYQGLATIEVHYPKFDFYLNGGGEYAGRTAYIGTDNFVSPATTYPVGYGSSLFSNAGCYTEPPPGSATTYVPGTVSGCTADTRSIFEGTVGFWYKFYKGSKGTIQWGPQFSYVVRNTWWGVAPAVGAPGAGISAPHMDEPMFLTSFRYYIP